MQLIKNQPFYFFLLVILINGVFLVRINQAKAVGDAYFPDDTTVTMDVADFTITGGSDADEVVTTNTTITIKISAGQSFTFKSSGRKLLNVNGDYTSKTCSATESSVVITPSAGDSQRTVVITPQSDTCTDTSSSGGGGGGGGGGSVTVSSTPTPTPTPAATVSPTTSPSVTPSIALTTKPTPVSKGFISLAAVSLKDGDVISAAGSADPDVYIVNPHGYKRLFLNPVIFGFYGHLGGFSKVKTATAITRDTFVTSGLFRNCETNDKKVYGVEVTAEDTGTLHWVNTTGAQAVADDPEFFKKVFCINTVEFNWYPKRSDYTSVNQIPDYARGSVSPAVSVTTVKKYKVFDTVYLNVRSVASTSGDVLGKLSEGQIVESLSQQGLWHKIKYQNKDAWVRGDYLKAL